MLRAFANSLGSRVLRVPRHGLPRATALSTSVDADKWLEEGNLWVKRDTNEETKAHIAELVDANDVASLEQLLSSRLSFGTAGLRGVMGAGYNRMNDLVILQTAQGLCE